VIIDADHFDLGYHGLIADVVNMYFDTFWPKALKISKELRDNNHTEKYVYTTFSWLASAYLSCPPNQGLHCPSVEQLATFKDAVKRGDITWPAFPFNSEHAAYDPSMVQFGVNMTHALDDLLGVPRKRVLANRDVPGLTRSLIPVLSAVGVRAINIAPNAQMAPSNVPPAFVWKDSGSGGGGGNGSSLFGVKDPSNQEMLTLFWDGWNYGIPGQPSGGCNMICYQTFPGCDTAVYFDWRGEDSGPNVDSAADVLKLYAEARAQYPGAEVVAGGLEDIVSALLKPAAYAALPRLTGEIGDTWSFGIQSDPKKTQDLRMMMRHRTDYAKTHPELSADHETAPVARQHPGVELAECAAGITTNARYELSTKAFHLGGGCLAWDGSQRGAPPTVSWSDDAVVAPCNGSVSQRWNLSLGTGMSLVPELDAPFCGGPAAHCCLNVAQFGTDLGRWAHSS
jgi:hypothetical protein